MKNVFLLFGLLITTAYFVGCSSQQAENTQEKAVPKPAVDTVAVVKDTVKPIEKTDTTAILPEKKFTVQIGAFITIDKANALAADANRVFQKEFIVSFNAEVKLYVVRSVQQFDMKIDAENLKTEIQKTKGFEDAWVVTLE
jgi:cell division septation protein DedD